MVGLAIGFILGAAVAKVVSALVNDIANPLLGILIGKSEGLKEASVQVGSAKVLWGDLVSTVIDFLVVALVIYIVVKMAGLDKLDKKKG